jgi:hypothetical protein
MAERRRRMDTRRRERRWRRCVKVRRRRGRGAAVKAAMVNVDGMTIKNDRLIFGRVKMRRREVQKGIGTSGI